MPSRPLPTVALTAEVRWVLLRAFGPAQAEYSDTIDGPRAAALAADLGLVERIVERVSPSRLVAELGPELARQLALSRLQAMARVRGLCDLLPELASATAAAAIPVVLLKFAALHAGGYLAEGSRAAGDVDVLVPDRDAPRAAQALIERGFFASEAKLSDHHHWPPLHDRQGRVVELHTRLPGLRPPGESRFAGFEALQRAGGLVPAPGLGPGCQLLRRDLLAAHLIAHGFAQHGGADAYPVTRALADVIDLLPGERRTTGIGAAAEWIADDVPASELDAVLGLCDALERGDPDGLDARRDTPEGALFQHVLASSLDPGYRRSLAVGQLLHSLSDEPRWWRFVKTVQCLAWPTRAQLAARLGLPSARVVTLRLRLAHARALAGRLPGLARAALLGAWRRVSRPGLD